MTTWERVLCWAITAGVVGAVLWLTNREATPKWDDDQTLEAIFDEG